MCMWGTFSQSPKWKSPIRLSSLEHYNNPRDKKNLVVAKDFKNIAPESSCFWCWCWFIGPAILHLTFGEMVAKQWQLCKLCGVSHHPVLVFQSVVFQCCSYKCRQVFSYSSSSQIPGTCDSQACCCCGDLNMGVKCIYFFIIFVASIRGQLHYLLHLWSCWSPAHNSGLQKNLLRSTTPSEPNKAPSSTASSREWRNVKLCWSH